MSAEQNPQTSVDDNKTIAREFLRHLSSEGNATQAPVASNYVGHFPPYSDVHGSQGCEQFAADTLAVYPDARYTVDDIAAAEGDKVVIRGTFFGTYKAQGKLDQAFDGAPLTMPAISIVQIENGKVKVSWTSIDFLGAMVQWGTLPELIGLSEEDHRIRVFVGDEELKPPPPIRVQWGKGEMKWPLIPPGLPVDRALLRWPIKW
jgi:predicted ester cyclase